MPEPASDLASRPGPRSRTARRILAAVALALAILAAIVPWSVDSERLAGRVSAQLRDAYGLSVEARGQSAVAFLPVPRLKLRKASVSGPDGRALVQDAQIRGELRLLPFLLGRIELTEITIAGGRIMLAPGAGGPAGWDEPLRWLRGRAKASAGHDLRRIVLIGSDLVLDPGRDAAPALRRLDAVVTWPNAAGELQVVGSALWRGETVTANLALRRPLALAEGRPSAFDLQASARPGSLALRGEVSNRDGWRFDGQTSGDAPSLGRLVRWLRHADAPAALDRSVAFSGGATLTPDEVGWSRLHLELGDDALEGALSLRMSPDGVSGSATLAAGRLDLRWLAAAGLAPLRDWAAGKVLARALARNRLDLRLSASSIQIGTLTLGDSALSVLVEGGRLDAALLRAGIDRGIVKGRITASLDRPDRDLRGSVSVEGVDMSTILAAFGPADWLGGTARGQASFEAFGAGDLLRRLGGHVSLTVNDGEVAAPSVAAILRRGLDEATSLKIGRTPFARAQLNLQLANGLAEIDPGSTIQGEGFQAELGGRISLPDRSLDLRADAGPRPASPAPSRVALDIRGPWNAPVFQRAAAGPPPGAREP